MDLGGGSIRHRDDRTNGLGGGITHLDRVRGHDIGANNKDREVLQMSFGCE